MIRRYAALILAGTFWVAGFTITNTPAAAAPVPLDGAYNQYVGWIDGQYHPSPHRDYLGTKRPTGNFCVWVQRKTLSTGQWVTSGVWNYSDCSYTDGHSDWAIRDDDYVSNTVAIRLYRFETGQYVVLCTSKSDCLSM